MIPRLFSRRYLSGLICSLSIVIALPGYAVAAPPAFDIPISCSLGTDCFIQNYFDHGPGTGTGYSDYTCGMLSYSGHTGTDFRLRDLVAMQNRVAVLASAAGTVVGARDGEADVNVNIRGKSALRGKEAGNAVRIDHGDGWETQYSHLLQGSIKVRVGQRVAPGDVLGFVGFSGNTEFPHVDFTVRKNGKPLDPFSPGAARCGSPDTLLWSNAARAALRYQPTGLLISGFATTEPTRDKAENGAYVLSEIPARADNILYWAEIFGLYKNDRMVIELYGPDRQRLLHHESILPGNKAVWFEYTGKRRITKFWPAGTYAAHFKLERAGTAIIDELREIVVR